MCWRAVALYRCCAFSVRGNQVPFDLCALCYAWRSILQTSYQFGTEISIELRICHRRRRACSPAVSRHPATAVFQCRLWAFAPGVNRHPEAAVPNAYSFQHLYAACYDPSAMNNHSRGTGSHRFRIRLRQQRHRISPRHHRDLIKPAGVQMCEPSGVEPLWHLRE